MIISPIESNDLDTYDNLVDISAQGTIFHKSWWLNIFKSYYGKFYEVKLYALYEKGSLIGAMPVPIFHRYGMKLIYAPKFTPYLGSLYAANNGEKICTKISRVKKINEKFAGVLKNCDICIYYPFSYNNIDMQPFKWDGFDIGVYYTYLLDLHDLDHILADMDKTRRHDIVKRSKQIYTVKTGKIEDHIELVNETMKRQSHPAVNKEIFMAVFKECKIHKNEEIFTIYDETDTPLASLLLIWDNKRSYYLSGGIKEDSRGDMSLLMWEAIRFTKEKLGLQEFDFEGSDVESIEAFFRGFGGHLTPFYFAYDGSLKRRLLVRAYQLYKGKLAK